VEKVLLPDSRVRHDWGQVQPPADRQISLEEVRATAAEWEAAKTWSGHSEKPAVISGTEKNETRITVADAIAAFTASRTNRRIALGTLKKYRTFTNQLRAYADSRGYVWLDQLDVSDMDRFYASWTDKKRSRAKKLERLKSFIRFCLKR
jgi:hypothetical protein